MKVGIIGAGPAGLTAGYELAKKGVEVIVYESDSDVGGMSKTIELWGQKVDLGSHRFFSNDKRVNDLWLEVIGQDYEMINRKSRIYYRNKFFHYPLRPLNVILNLGPLEAVKCIFSYLKEVLAPTKSQGCFESWIINKFGKRLYNIFFKVYSEKLWGIPCTELDDDFAKQRIRKISLFEAMKSAFLFGFNNKHKSFVDKFAYPSEGTGSVYKKMAKFISENGGAVICNTQVAKLITEKDLGKKIIGIELRDGTKVSFDHVISTMPLNAVTRGLPRLPEKISCLVNQLKFRNTIIVFAEINNTNLFKDNWIYVHSNKLKTGRISNFRNWSKGLYGESQSSILALEFWCNNEDSIWSSKDELLSEMARNDLIKSKLVKNSEILNLSVRRIKNCYPIYKKGYKNELRPIEQYLSALENISFIGRGGSFKYNNQDHSILMGLLVAENILSNEKVHDLWEINTDYDNYQEDPLISESGLEQRVSLADLNTSTC